MKGKVRRIKVYINPTLDLILLNSRACKWVKYSDYTFAIPVSGRSSDAPTSDNVVKLLSIARDTTWSFKEAGKTAGLIEPQLLGKP